MSVRTVRTATKPSAKPAPVSKIRQYLNPKQGRYFDPNSPDTPEGRLSKYNPEDWYVPAKNEHDHSKSILVELPDPILDELSRYVSSGKFPLNKSNKQAVRVAIVEFLQILRKLEPVEDSNMALIETMTYLHAKADTAAKFEQQFEKGRQDVHKYMAMNAINEARKLACDLIALARKIEIRELKDKYKSQLEREFRGLIKSGRKSVKTNVRKNKGKGKAKSSVQDELDGLV